MMNNIAKDLIGKGPKKEKESVIKPLTVVFWSDFMAHPHIMYNLFAPTPKHLNYDQDQVKVMGTKDGMISQINVNTVEDIDSICEELLGMPLLLRVWGEHTQQNAFEVAGVDNRWEGDLALLIDTAHPMIRPELEKGLERCRKHILAGKKFCFILDFAPALSQWLKKCYPQPMCTLGTVLNHKAHLYITNYDRPLHFFDCNKLWVLFGPCWLLTAPLYKLYRLIRCRDVVIKPMNPIVRRAILPNGKIVEIIRSTCAPTVVID